MSKYNKELKWIIKLTKELKILCLKIDPKICKKFDLTKKALVVYQKLLCNKKSYFEIFAKKTGKNFFVFVTNEM